MSNIRHRVGFITEHKDYRAGATLGDVVVDYLITTRSEPDVNVELIFSGGNVISAYNPEFYLNLTLSKLKLNDFVLNRSPFVSLEDEDYSLNSLKNYLSSIKDISIEEKSLYNKTRSALNALQTEFLTVESIPETEYEYEEFIEENFEEELYPMPRIDSLMRPVMVESKTIKRSPMGRVVETRTSPRRQVRTKRTGVASRTPVLKR